MIAVRLTREEFAYALDLGRRRQAENEAAGLQHAYGLEDNAKGLPYHQDGALCEVATAKGLDVEFIETKLREPDIGPNIQVRGTEWRNGRLILHPGLRKNGDQRDPDAHRFVLVTHDRRRTRDFRLVGWAWGAEGKRPEFWRDPNTGRPAFFVARERMRAMSTLWLPTDRHRYKSPVGTAETVAVAAE